ncbi:MAG TPA: hypothetical protein VLI88_00115 [Patescibacteria group bacterium]|nr:hypothetical protein [Patescibacteria group bacterium]
MVPKPGDEERTSIIPSIPRRLGTENESDDDKATSRPCPHCGEAMVRHDAEPDSPKYRAWHCDACGGCWTLSEDGWAIRDGHPPPAGWDAE